MDIGKGSIIIDVDSNKYVIGREYESDVIVKFIKTSVDNIINVKIDKNQNGNSEDDNYLRFLYICGSSGTGKTMSIFNLFSNVFGCDFSCLKFLKNEKNKDNIDEVYKQLSIKGFSYVNAMRCSKPKDIFSFILNGIITSQASLENNIDNGIEFGNENPDKAMKFLQDIFIPKSKAKLSSNNNNSNDDYDSKISLASKRRKLNTTGCFIVVIDEIDQLITDNQSVLDTLFEWAINPSSCLILIGIANRVDLHEKYLEKLSKYSKTEISIDSQLLIFKAYDSSQISRILTKTLLIEHNCTDEDQLSKIISKDAIEMCSKKVAAKSGDCRRALYICKCAISKNMKDDGSIGDLVKISHIASTVRALESPFVSIIQSLPQFLKYVLIALARLQKINDNETNQNITKKDYIPFSSAFQSYSKVIQTLSLPRVDPSSFQEMLPQLESNGLIAINEKSKTKSKTKSEMSVTLLVQSSDVEYACSDSVQLRQLLKN